LQINGNTDKSFWFRSGRSAGPTFSVTRRDNPSYEYLKTQILNELSNQFEGTETTYTANLDAAQKFFRDKLKDLEHPELERLFKALTQKFLFNVYELEEELEVFVVFETMNNRGKPLSQLELLKKSADLFIDADSGADQR
jgi:uncharacterized protein DUF262